MTSKVEALMGWNILWVIIAAFALTVLVYWLRHRGNK